MLFILLGSTLVYGESYRILSCDGGGIRGAATLKVLKELQKSTGIQIHEAFDVYAGTSTGSIIALSLALGVDVEEILSDYEEMSGDVFTRSSYLTLFRPEYSATMLKNSLINILEKKGYGANATLGDLPKKVIVPAVRLNAPEEGRWRLDVLENFTTEGKKIKIIDAVLESSAAPTYFSSENNYIDGGTAMNDPSLAALMVIFNPDTAMLKDFTIFGVGTGYEKQAIEGDENWGELQWISPVSGSDAGSIPLVDLLLGVQDQIPSQVLSKLLGERYRKFDFPLEESFPLDAAYKIPELLKYTETYIETHPEIWSETTSWLTERILNQ